MMRFARYHALGNDYLVIEPATVTDGYLSPEAIQLICHRHYGVGSDGILFGPIPGQAGGDEFDLKIYNPDGSEAEKSGNGLRIFARYLWDNGLLADPAAQFLVNTLGGQVTAQVIDQAQGRSITVAMGSVRFPDSTQPLMIAAQTLDFVLADVGNPHCVILCQEAPTPAQAQRLGPLIEVEPRFAQRTNVQFMQVLDRNTIRIEIWERGAGYTLASGSSSTAAAAVAYKLGLCAAAITVQMPGGTLQIQLDTQFNAIMTGPVTRICTGEIDPQILSHQALNSMLGAVAEH